MRLQSADALERNAGGLHMPKNENITKFKALLKDFGYYLVDFFMSILIGLGAAIIINIPIKFLRLINIDLCSFIVGILSMCIT